MSDLVLPLDMFERLMAELSAASPYSVEELAPDVYRIRPREERAESVALVGLTHGDEVIGLHVIIDIALQLLEGRLSLEVDLYLILANRSAYLKERRYIDVDLNRIYGSQEASSLAEHKRKSALTEHLEAATYIVDYHQTVDKTRFPFIFLCEKKRLDWVRTMAPAMPIVLKPETDQITTLSSWAASKGKYVMTPELGSSGVDPYQLSVGVSIARNVIQNAAKPIPPAHPLRTESPIYSVTYFEPYSGGQVRFAEDYAHFDPVKGGDIVAYLDAQPIKAPHPGYLLLYPKSWFTPHSTVTPDGLFLLLKKD